MLAPKTDGDTLEVLDDAVVALDKRRGIYVDVDTPLHLLASLITEAHFQLPLAVCAARCAGSTWPDIAVLLGTDADDARRRFDNAPVVGRRWPTTT